MGALLGLHRAEPRTAQELAEPPADTISAFLRRYAGAVGMDLVTMRQLSLRDIAHLMYWRAERSKTDDERERDSDLHDELFGEVR